MSDVLTAPTWIYQVLTADAAFNAASPGGVYDDLAPEGTLYPYTVLTLMSNLPVSGVRGGRTVMWNELWLVKGICEGESYAPAAAILNRARALLHRASGQTAGGVVVACVEASAPIRYVEPDGGRWYRHWGMEFRVYTQ